MPGVPTEFAEHKLHVRSDVKPDPMESEAERSFKLATETKKIPLDPEHPERYIVMGTNLDSK